MACVSGRTYFAMSSFRSAKISRNGRMSVAGADSSSERHFMIQISRDIGGLGKRNQPVLPSLRQFERMHIIAHTVRESSGMVGEADADNSTAVIMLARLNDLRPVPLQSLQRFLRRTHDRDMAGLMFIWVRKHDHDQVAAIGFCLGLSCTTNFSPALALGLCTVQPFRLSISQQHLTVLGRAENVDSHFLCRRRGKCTAVRMLSGSCIVAVAIGFTGLPIDVLIGEP